MAPIWTLAKKELRLLLRDPRAAVLLLGMPLLFILLLGLLVGEGFGQKSDEKLRVSLVILDEGHTVKPGTFPQGAWADIVKRDLEETGGIRLEIIADRETADRLCRDGKRPAVLVLGPKFSERLDLCSFITEQDTSHPSGPAHLLAQTFAAQGLAPAGAPLGGIAHELGAYGVMKTNVLAPDLAINPFYRDGVKMKEVDAELLTDKTQEMTASVIEQVAQVSLLRVVLPWMIGKAFEKISEPQFIDRLGSNVRLPVPKGDNAFEQAFMDAKFAKKGVKAIDGKMTLNEALHVASANEKDEEDYRGRVGDGVQQALKQQFSKFDLTGKTWADLTKAQSPGGGQAGPATDYVPDGSGLLKRGAIRYQTLVPSYTVMFAFALLVVVGWLFVSERRRGTTKRLRAAPITRSQVLFGKFLPCLAIAILQGVFLLIAGKLVFGMHWGPDSWPIAQQVLWVLAVVVATAFAAMGLSMLIAALMKTEMQVAIYGSVLVMALGLISGCLWPREQMPDSAKEASLITPHAWALDAYKQLLVNSEPNMGLVITSCLVLAGFGAGFLALAWAFLRLE
jgi:ABC-2 type transport system permease protein